MDTFFKDFNLSDGYLISILAVLFLVLIINLSNALKISKLSKKYNRFIRSFQGIDIEDSLTKFVEKVEKVSLKNSELENRCNKIDEFLPSCFQKIGVVRFNAFADVGSDLSFAIALLDGNDNGFVINGIYARESSSTYAKPIENGKSKYTLSAEEMQAIDLAKRSSSMGFLNIHTGSQDNK